MFKPLKDTSYGVFGKFTIFLSCQRPKSAKPLYFDEFFPHYIFDDLTFFFLTLGGLASVFLAQLASVPASTPSSFI